MEPATFPLTSSSNIQTGTSSTSSKTTSTTTSITTFAPIISPKQKQTHKICSQHQPEEMQINIGNSCFHQHQACMPQEIPLPIQAPPEHISPPSPPQNLPPNSKMPASINQKSTPTSLPEQYAPKITIPTTTNNQKPTPEHSTSITGKERVPKNTTLTHTTKQTEIPALMNLNTCLPIWFYMNTIPLTSITILLSSSISPSTNFLHTLHESNNRRLWRPLPCLQHQSKEVTIN